MSKGYSLHIGLNKLDTNHYPGTPKLKAAVNDAIFWESFANKLAYKTATLHDEHATVETVLQHLADYAALMIPGDILLLTYAGHGAEIPNDKPGGFDEERNDQTWCLYDRQLLDDELYEAFEAYKEGTRILIVSDSCHSGTISRADDIDLSRLLANGMVDSAKTRGFSSRMLPRGAVEVIHFNSGKTIYEPIQKKYKTKHQGVSVKAAVKLLAACQDDEETLDGAVNGIFTEAFMDIFTKEEFKNATAEQLINEVSTYYFFPKPNFCQYGGIIPSYDNGFPFNIDIPNAEKISGYRKPDLNSAFKSTRVVAPITAQWDTLEQKKNAVLLIEVEGGLNATCIGGNEIIILEKKQKGDSEIITIELPGVAYEHSWSAAHAIQTELDKQGYAAIVEPILTVVPAQNERGSREGDANNPDYIKEWPPSLQQNTVGIGWHLDDQHSQLSKANEFVASKKPDRHIRIGHLDTGYIEGHIALPENLNTTLAQSFINKENPNQAVDKSDSGQDGHGLGTMTLLAGKQVPKSSTFNEYEGYIGGVPFAEVIPLRIAESVVIFNSESFCDAIDYAIEKGCEVISMSMAGKPSKRMAKAVNKAYEAGIVMVTAASNCWYKGPGALLPKCVMFPAAFERVIAATGAMYDQKPYDIDFIQQDRAKIGNKYMQGSWGPASRMTRALAAYTPNTPWASTHHAFLRSGGGTSSATPQVAAAAAVWIAYHREALEQKGYYEPGNQWKKIEAVRHALFSSAAKDVAFADWKKYYGNGIVKAYDALQVGVKEIVEHDKAPVAESSFFGITELVGSFFKNRSLFRSGDVKPAPEALAVELMQLLQTDPQFYELFSTLDLSSPAAVEAVVNKVEFKNKVMQSPYASNYLKQSMAE
ncbi:MAG: caspase family protein [Saprospiraceae bacterium]|nr:caspase family protein [Candidatus Vicinibacter affinis]